MARTTVSDVEAILPTSLDGQSNIQEWIDIASALVDTIEDKGQTENLERIEQTYTACLIQSNPESEGDRKKSSIDQESGGVEFVGDSQETDYCELAQILDTTGTIDPEDSRETPNLRTLDSRGLYDD